MNMPLKKLSGRFMVLPLVILLASVVPSGCYQDYNLGVEDFDAYLTKYVEGTNFQAYKYFIMPDTIMHLIDQGVVVDPIAGYRKYDKQILSLTASNFEARGYVRLKDTLEITGGIDPKTVFLVLIGQFANEHTGYYYDYWYGYWGGYWGWYYPGYYPPAYVDSYEYTVGTTVTEMADYAKSAGERKHAPVWVGVIAGLAGAPATAQQRLGTAVNTQFEQSPYLYAGQ